MNEDRTQRRLAAILAADMVGYSRLMGQDEAGTLAALKVLRTEVIDPKVAEHSGRVFKSTGDGLLAEFPSVVNAVSCAVAIQQGMKDNTSNSSIQLRIGINVGDVIVEDGDVFGDGVNVASRVESIASPGGIALTETARDHLGSRLKLDFTDTGTHSLKNIERPIRVFVVGEVEKNTRTVHTGITDKPSIAVLPFVNMSGDPEQQYFSDGITEDIITELARFRSLLVIARNSSFQFRSAADVKQIARTLGAQYLVEGSVRKSSNRIRITAQLVDAMGNHSWAEHYDRDMQDIFAVQDELAQAIAATIEGRMAASGAAHSRNKPTNDLVAYDCFLQGREAIERRGDHDLALLLLKRAVELDRNFAQAHAWLARVYIFKLHVSLDVQWLSKALEVARKAVSLDEADAFGHAVLGYALTIQGQHDVAGLHLERAITLNPTDVRITSKHALWLAYTGRGDEAVRRLDADLRRDPFPPAWFWDFRGLALFQARKYEEAIVALSHLTTLYFWDYQYLAASYAHLGLTEKAREFAAETLKANPRYTITQIILIEPYRDPADLDRLFDGLRKAGLPE